MKFPPDRHGDNRWNLCLDRLIEAWNQAGPDAVLAELSRLARDEPGAAEDAAGEQREPLWAAAEKARAEGRLKPPPRMPSVRPESDYEMHLPGEAG